MPRLKFSKRISIALFIFVCLASSLSLRAETTVAILGDSLTKGHGLTLEEAFPHLLEEMLNKSGHDVKVINGGISGSTTTGGLDRLKWLMRSDPEIVIIALGANDGLRGVPVKTIRARLASMIQYAQQKQAKVILAGMQLPPTYEKSYRKEFEAMYLSLAEQYQTILIPFLLEGVAGIRALNLADGIHPNEEGHEIIAKTVYLYLEPLL